MAVTFSEREYIRGRGYQAGMAGLKLDSAEQWCARCSNGHICARGLQRAAHAAFGEHPILADSAEWSERLDTYTVGYLEGAAFQLAERAQREGRK